LTNSAKRSCRRLTVMKYLISFILACHNATNNGWTSTRGVSKGDKQGRGRQDHLAGRAADRHGGGMITPPGLARAARQFAAAGRQGMALCSRPPHGRKRAFHACCPGTRPLPRRRYRPSRPNGLRTVVREGRVGTDGCMAEFKVPRFLGGNQVMSRRDRPGPVT